MCDDIENSLTLTTKTDARVPANIITGTDANEMFVHRNVANQVLNNDMSVMTVLNFAIDTLKVSFFFFFLCCLSLALCCK
jgi:hypothetical protein